MRYKAQPSPDQPADELCCLPGVEPGGADSLPCSIAVLPCLSCPFRRLYITFCQS